MNIRYFLIVLFLFSETTYAQECGKDVGAGLNKEFLQLTYMSSADLQDEYCTADYIKKSSMDLFDRLKVSGYSESLERANQQMQVCNDYAQKVLQVLSKDHKIDSVKCEGMKANREGPTQ